MSFNTATPQRNSAANPSGQGFKNIPLSTRPVEVNSTWRSSFVFTDSEQRDQNLPFDYVATAVNFIIQNMHRPDATMEAFKQYAPAWFQNHRWSGRFITHAECNGAQDELLNFLRVKVNDTAASRVASAIGGR